MAVGVNTPSLVRQLLEGSSKLSLEPFGGPKQGLQSLLDGDKGVHGKPPHYGVQLTEAATRPYGIAILDRLLKAVQQVPG